MLRVRVYAPIWVGFWAHNSLNKGPFSTEEQEISLHSPHVGASNAVHWVLTLMLTLLIGISILVFLRGFSIFTFKHAPLLSVHLN